MELLQLSLPSERQKTSVAPIMRTPSSSANYPSRSNVPYQ